MPIANTYEVEDAIVNQISSLFADDMIFTDEDTSAVSNEIFDDIHSDNDKLAVMVLNAGFRADPLVGNSKAPKQRLKLLWQVVIVCPIELYKTVGGVKMMEVAQLLKGYRLSAELGIMQLIDDERGFNRPNMEDGRLAYLPMMFTVDTVI